MRIDKLLSIPRPIPVIAALLLLLSASACLAGGSSSARSMAMSGAYMSLAKGVDAARYNPANLGLSDHRQSGLQLVGLGVNIKNNSLSLDDYNRYTGAFLSESDKADILGKIPSEGLTLTADVEASAMSVSRGSMAFSVTGIGVADVNLSRDVLDLILNGNYYGQEIRLTGSYSDATAYIQTAFSFGKTLYSLGSRELAVGASVKYLHGLATEQVVELDGIVATLETGFDGEGHITAQTATGGSGYGLDLGASLKISDDYTVGACIRNFVSSLSWSNDTEEHGYTFSFDTMTVDNMEDDYVVSEDYSNDIDWFSTNLPSVVNVGFANTSGRLLWAVEWEQGFRRAAGSSSKPRLAVGAEYEVISLVALRTGFATGGRKGTGFSFGSGFDLAVVQIDIAATTGSSLSPYSTRGLNFAASMGVRF